MTARIATGVGWMFLFKLIDRGLAIVSTLVLARLLMPADFGLVAMAMAVIAVLELITSLSFDVVLIQKPALQRAHYDTAWTLNALLSLACAALTAALAHPAALFYGEPRLSAVMFVLAVAWAIGGLENIGIVDFRRHLNFRREFHFMAAKRILGFAITIGLALTLRSYWALVIGTVIGRAFGVALSFYMHPFRPRPCLAATRELFAFSSWLLINNLLAVAQTRYPHLVIGRLFGPQSLGIYTVGSEIAQIPSTDLLAPINRVVFPGLARLADDVARLRATFQDATALTAFFAVPAACGLAAVAHPLVLVLLGERWLDAIPVIQTLAFVAALYGVTSINSPAFLALGEPRFITTIAALRLLLLIPLVWLLSQRFGILGAAYAELATYAMAAVLSSSRILSRLQISAAALFSRLWRSLSASAVMGYAVYLFVDAQQLGSSSLDALPVLAAAVALGIGFYLAAVALLWALCGRPQGAERVLLDFVRKNIGRIGKARS